MDNKYSINNDNQLQGDGLQYIACPKNTQKFEQGMPDTIIIHYTAGGDAQSSAKYLADNNIKASAHIVVSKDTTIFQLVPFDTIAWHAGKSEYNGRHGFNRYSIGIEIANAGIVEKNGNQFVSWFGKKYQPEDVVSGINRNETLPRYWEIYTPFQIQAVTDICKLLVKKYGIKHILGHEEIAPHRKTDPGPAFPLDKMRDLIFNDRKSDEIPLDNSVKTVAVEKLNIRMLPDLTGQIVAAPLNKGTKLEIIQRVNGWAKVRTKLEGWVYEKYLE